MITEKNHKLLTSQLFVTDYTKKGLASMPLTKVPIMAMTLTGALTLKVKLKMKVKCQNRTIKLLKPKVKGPNTVNIERFRKNFDPGFT